MIPVQQTNTNGRGNCMAACLASILEIEIETVPDYRAIEAAGGSWLNALNTWLTKHHRCLYVEPEHYLTQRLRPVGWHLMNYGNASGGHSVVGHNGVAIWDPMGVFRGEGVMGKPYSWGILVLLDDELLEFWKTTWNQCLCPRCIRGGDE